MPSIRQRECERGFWIPDEVGRLLLVEGSPAVLFYLFLGQYQTLADYPPASHLASLMGMETALVWELIERLHDVGALNDSDVRAIFLKSEEDETSP